MFARQRLWSLAAATVCLATGLPGIARANINLEWRISPAPPALPGTIEVGLFAVSDDLNDQPFTAIDMVFVWDAAVLRLHGGENTNGVPWFLVGFVDDRNLDGLNADCGPDQFCDPFTGLPFNDGQALFEAVAPLFSSINATPDGFLVTTLIFQMLAGPAQTQISIVSSGGPLSSTKILNGPAQDVTGTFGAITVSTEKPVPTLSPWGVGAMVLLLAVAGAIVLKRRGRFAA